MPYSAHSSVLSPDAIATAIPAHSASPAPVFAAGEKCFTGKISHLSRSAQQIPSAPRDTKARRTPFFIRARAARRVLLSRQLSRLKDVGLYRRKPRKDIPYLVQLRAAHRIQEQRNPGVIRDIPYRFRGRIGVHDAQRRSVDILHAVRGVSDRQVSGQLHIVDGGHHIAGFVMQAEIHAGISFRRQRVRNIDALPGAGRAQRIRQRIVAERRQKRAFAAQPDDLFRDISSNAARTKQHAPDIGILLHQFSFRHAQDIHIGSAEHSNSRIHIILPDRFQAACSLRTRRSDIPFPPLPGRRPGRFPCPSAWKQASAACFAANGNWSAAYPPP